MCRRFSDGWYDAVHDVSSSHRASLPQIRGKGKQGHVDALLIAGSCVVRRFKMFALVFSSDLGDESRSDVGQRSGEARGDCACHAASRKP